MKRILFISYASPLAPFSGFAYRALGMLSWLLDRFYVDLVFQGSRQDLSSSFVPLERFGQIEVVFADLSIARKIAGVIGKLPYHHAVFSHPQMRETVLRRLAEDSYDIVWLNKSVHFPILQNAEPLPPVIIDQIAAEPYVWRNLIDNDPRWYARWFFKLNMRRVLRYDANVYRKVAGVICITEADQALTEQHYPGTRTICVPQGFDPVYYAPDGQADPDPDVLLFSGTGAVRNLQAVQNLIRETMPSVHRQCPDLRLLWIGNVEKAEYPFLNLPWIETTGFVEHTPPYFNRGMIYVAPFDMGEGMKTKVVEAMAMGKVIVSTPVGVHGIDVQGLPFVKVCSDYKAFANAIIEFRETPGLLELGKLAREYALAHYTWDKVLMPLGPFLDECMRA